MFDYSKKVTYIPKTKTVNNDRRYYIFESNFIKEDFNITRGMNEAKILEYLNNFNLSHFPKYFHSEIDSNIHRLIISKIEGHTLENFNFNDVQKRSVMGQLFEIYGLLIKFGVIHNDINESNLIYEPVSDKLYLIDFETAEMAANLNSHGKDLLGPPWGILHILKTRLL